MDPAAYGLTIAATATGSASPDSTLWISICRTVRHSSGWPQDGQNLMLGWRCAPQLVQYFAGAPDAGPAPCAGVTAGSVAGGG